MITLFELLEDPLYKKFFIKVPERSGGSSKPWRLYVQRRTDGPWALKDVGSYARAFDLFKTWRSRGVHDAAIHSRGLSFAQPTKWVKVTKGGKPVMVTGSNGLKSQKVAQVLWTPKLPPGEPAHTWCLYCRRPTIFRVFSKHHTFPGNTFDISHGERCTICGVSLTLTRGY